MQLTKLPSTEICLESAGADGKGRPMRGLLDTGCAETLVTKEFTNQCIETEPQECAAHGNKKFRITKATPMKLKPVEFSDSKVVTFQCMVDTTGNRQSHDMILGLDFLSATGMELNFSKNAITWDGLAVEMRKLGQSLDQGVN